MSRPRIRELHGLERLRAAADAMRWGYPREIAVDELVAGHWFRYGERSLFWLVADGLCAPGEWNVHIAVAPGSRARDLAPGWRAALEVVGDLLGADRLIAVPTVGSPARQRAVRILLLLNGWTRARGRWYLSLSEAPLPAWVRARRARRRSAGRPRSPTRSVRGRER